MSNPNSQADQNGSAKEKTKFQENLKSLENIFAEDLSILSPRVSSTAAEVKTIIDELYAEKKEEKKAQFKSEFKSLIEKFVQFNKEVNAKKKELEKLENDKMKEFNGVASALFGKINDFKSWMIELNEATQVAASGNVSSNEGNVPEGNAPQA